MINELQVQNFKSIRNSGKLELKPLTILAGPNSSGKSNLLECIAFISQVTHLSGEYSHSFESLLRHGNFIRYPDVSFIAHCKNKKLPIGIKLSFPLSEKEGLEFPMSAGEIGYKIKYKPERRELEQTIFLNSGIFVKTVYVSTETGFISKFQEPSILRKYSPVNPTSEILDFRIFNPLIVHIPDNERLEIGDTLRKARMCVNIILEKLKRIFPIFATRGSIPHVEKTREEPLWIGKNGENLLSLLSLIFSKREYSLKAEKIRSWASEFGVNSLAGGWWGGDQIGVDFEDPTFKVPFELSLASFGARQVLSIITQIFWSKKGDTITIEEPEISLHPESQIKLFELFAEAVKEGKQIICTTHSPFIIIALSKVIKNRKLSSKEVAIFHAKKTPKGTKFSNLPVDEKGFIKGWIPSFAKVEDKLLDELSDIFRE